MFVCAFPGVHVFVLALMSGHVGTATAQQLAFEKVKTAFQAESRFFLTTAQFDSWLENNMKVCVCVRIKDILRMQPDFPSLLTSTGSHGVVCQ